MIPVEEHQHVPGSPEDILATIERVLTTLDTLDGAMAVYARRMAEIGGQLEAAESRLAIVVKMLTELEWVIEDETAS